MTSLNTLPRRPVTAPTVEKSSLSSCQSTNSARYEPSISDALEEATQYPHLEMRWVPNGKGQLISQWIKV